MCACSQSHFCGWCRPDMGSEPWSQRGALSEIRRGCGAGVAHYAGTARRCYGNSDLLPSPGCGNPGEDVPAMPLWAASSAARLDLPSRGRTPRGSGCSCPWMPERGLRQGVPTSLLSSVCSPGGYSVRILKQRCDHISFPFRDLL